MKGFLGFVTAFFMVCLVTVKFRKYVILCIIMHKILTSFDMESAIFICVGINVSLGQYNPMHDKANTLTIAPSEILDELGIPKVQVNQSACYLYA